MQALENRYKVSPEVKTSLTSEIAFQIKCVVTTTSVNLYIFDTSGHNQEQNRNKPGKQTGR